MVNDYVDLTPTIKHWSFAGGYHTILYGGDVFKMIELHSLRIPALRGINLRGINLQQSSAPLSELGKPASDTNLAATGVVVCT